MIFSMKARVALRGIELRGLRFKGLEKSVKRSDIVMTSNTYDRTIASQSQVREQANQTSVNGDPFKISSRT